MSAALDLFRTAAGLRRCSIVPEMRECASVLREAMSAGPPGEGSLAMAVALSAVAMRLSSALSPADVSAAPVAIAAEHVGPGDAEAIAQEVMVTLAAGRSKLSPKETALSCIALAAALVDAMDLTELVGAGFAGEDPMPARAHAPVPRPVAASRQTRRLADRQARRGAK